MTTPAKPEPIETSAEKEPAAQTASLRISFQSDMPGLAQVRVHVNSQNIFHETVGETRAFMRKGKGGRVGASRVVEAGNAKIEVWVTPPNGVGKLLTQTGNFPGGSVRTLNIRLSESGTPSIALN